MLKTALVTGGSRGIGEAVCRTLAEGGWNIALCYKNSEREANDLAAELGGAAIRCDVSRPDEVERLFAAVNDRFGGIGLLVNNAGISEYGLLTDLSFERWNELIATNLTGVFNCCKAAVGNMVREKSGCIINIASMWGEVGASCEAAYSASKAGVIGLTKALAKELAPSGIRVNAVSPGCIDTEMMSRFSPEELSAIREETPLGFIGSGEDIANAVRFLASERARFITGQVLGVNGGFVI